MREQNIIDELNRFDTDERYALEKYGYSAEGELSDYEQAVLDYEKNSERKKITKPLHLIQRWNHCIASGVPPRFAIHLFSISNAEMKMKNTVSKKWLRFRTVRKMMVYS